jgi:hypothetical protein
MPSVKDQHITRLAMNAGSRPATDDETRNICAHCSCLFDGNQVLYRAVVLLRAEDIDLISPTNCRICLIIRSRHAYHIGSLPSDDKNAQLVKVTYDVKRNKEDASVDALDLNLTLHYSDGIPEWLVLIVRRVEGREILRNVTYFITNWVA